MLQSAAPAATLPARQEARCGVVLLEALCDEAVIECSRACWREHGVHAQRTALGTVGRIAGTESRIKLAARGSTQHRSIEWPSVIVMQMNGLRVGQWTVFKDKNHLNVHLYL